jgi:hypothetical protein
MLSRDRAPRAEGERVCAVRRLDAAVVEQTRVRGQHEAAKGTSGELQATLRRRPLIGQVIKRRRLIGTLKGRTERIAPIMRLGRGDRRPPC